MGMFSAKAIAAASTIVISPSDRNALSRSNTILKQPFQPPWLTNPSLNPVARPSAVQSSISIDDRYFSIGQERPQPQQHDLEAAISAALADKPVPQSGGPPVGCSIVYLDRRSLFLHRTGTPSAAATRS